MGACRCHDAYGKGLIKRIGVGPDAFVQMVLQVAYVRDQGAFCQTYESSMARLFLNGAPAPDFVSIGTGGSPTYTAWS